MNKDYEIVKDINYLLEKRCEFLLGRMREIRDYLIECKLDKSTVDIDILLDWLN